MSKKDKHTKSKLAPIEKRKFEPVFQPNFKHAKLEQDGFPCESACESMCESACEPCKRLPTQIWA